MKDKILSALKNKYKNLGFSEKAFDGVADYLTTTVTEDSQIDNAIGGVEILLKSFQSDIDKRVTEAIAKAKADAKPEPPAPPATPASTTPPKPEVPEWAKGILDRLEAFERKEAKQSLAAQAKAKLAEKRIPESFMRGRSLDVEKQEDIDKLVATVEADYTAFRQYLVNEGVIISTPNESGGDKAAEAVAKQIAEKRNNPTAATAGVTAKKLI